MFYSPDLAPHFPGFAYVVSAAADTSPARRSAAGFIPGGTIPLSQIQIGEAIYHLRSPVQGEFVPDRGGTWEFWAEGFSPMFVGRGPQTDSAFQDWRDQVHECFQELYRKRPFEMMADERARWKVLEDLIDVAAYQNETPILVRQIGQVTKARPLPRQITWADGTKESNINLDQMPDEFAAYKPGQWFEAIVERDPLTRRIRRVRYVKRVPSLRKLSGTVLNEYWSSLPGTTTLPASSRDWTHR
jgi:hypothetical protein